MHEIQKKLLNLAQETNLGQITLREIGALVGISSPQQVKHHLDQLTKKGLLTVDKSNRLIQRVQKGQSDGLLNEAKLINIPVFGTANAGPAELFADQHVEGFLRVSSSLLDSKLLSHNLFAIKVKGPSMNRTNLNNKTIDDSDYIIVDGDDREPQDGSVVLSVIDGLANVKRLKIDSQNHQIMLVSESTQDFPPIVIHENDDYSINGRVVQVIKNNI